ncbi:hypothetical protein OROHE_024435 [Orobanche hederae]
MGDENFESSTAAEESEFVNRKRAYEEEEEEDSCEYSEYGDVENAVKAAEEVLDSYDDDVSQEYREYCIQTELSEGFNVPSPPDGTIGGICPLDNSDGFWPFAEEGAEIAVEHYNDNRAPLDGKLRLVRLETATSSAGMVYYLTFEAENVTSGERKMYQSQVYRRIDGYWSVLSFRKKKLAV